MAATILSVQNLSQRYVSEIIFSNVTFQVTERERVALVGTNGSGKSTLLKIIAGLEQQESGSLDFAGGLRVAYQAQEARFDTDRTVYEEALDAFRDVRDIGVRMSEIEQEMAQEVDESLDRLFEEYSGLSALFESRHGYEMEHRTAQVLGGLGFPESQFTEPVVQLSGGQKTRVALAKTLLGDPDLLLLDEPTNHLDLQAIEWLEGFLATWNRAFIIVSHDRYFLDRVTNRTMEIAFGALEDYPAPYGRFLKLREERLERRKKEYEAQQAYIARTEEFVRKYKAGQRSREARGRETRLQRLERIPEPKQHPRLTVTLTTRQKSGEIVLSSDPLRIGYQEPDGSEEVLAETDELIIQRGDRVAIVGPNGSGKTTALRTIVGEIPALKGTVSFGTNVKMAYYAQAHEGLARSHSALESILEDQPMGEELARNLLGRFLFSNDDVYKPVTALSGGERSRLALARLSLENANFLILDEPTNHLDILARESLEDVLRRYDGTILFVSHDRYFIDRIANKIWSIEDEKIVPYLGNYTDMMHHKGVTSVTPAPAAEEPEVQKPNVEPESEKPQQTRSRGEQRLLDRHIREIRKRVVAAEREVNNLEKRLNEINDELASATADQDTDEISRLGEEYEVLQNKLEVAYATWTEAGAELDEAVSTYALTSEG